MDCSKTVDQFLSAIPKNVCITKRNAINYFTSYLLKFPNKIEFRYKGKKSCLGKTDFTSLETKFLRKGQNLKVSFLEWEEFDSADHFYSGYFVVRL
ncbi:hypothetical protein EGR_05245 [Echinococcus granulosus]|uniref:Uncharacterized protein n=1 Tax=Echinococcus granulosus TaxID=6210 RepID=W6V1X8_ECHGR|nr:hypothetical protein EGR_05245 [Echinococcus granulosus]EUB59919.1 hypothetical protein EGR_05245 [Echinococcus granulosus]